MAAQDLQENLRALEKRHVSEVYDQIAAHFTDIKHKAWPKVRQFLKELEPGSLVADVGCGNGRYLHINKKIFKIGTDMCEGLVNIADQRGHEVMVSDNLRLPYRDGVFDAAISIAVIHHFATTERRVQALSELARIIRPGGKLMIYVWAFEQKHRRFDAQDVLVPWNKPTKHHRRRATSKSSGGTGSDFSSTSSISEDDVTGETAGQGDVNMNPESTATTKSQKSDPTQCNGASAACKSSCAKPKQFNGVSLANNSSCCYKTGSCNTSMCEKGCVTCYYSKKTESSGLSWHLPSNACTPGPGAVCCSQNAHMTRQRSHSPPVRPSSLHLLHRHTAEINSSQNSRTHVSATYNAQRKNIPARRHITSSQYKSDPPFTRHDSSQKHHQNGIKDRTYHCSMKSSVKLSNRKNRDYETSTTNINHDKSGRSSSNLKHNSITKQFLKKDEAAAVLTVSKVEQKEQTSAAAVEKQEPSVFSKLKTLFMGKSKNDIMCCNSHGKNSQENLDVHVPVSSWQEYYKKCVKDVEDDLKSFRSFCSLTHTDKKQDVLFREFVVREFPASSQTAVTADLAPVVNDELLTNGQHRPVQIISSRTSGSRVSHNAVNLDGNGNPFNGTGSPNLSNGNGTCNPSKGMEVDMVCTNGHKSSSIAVTSGVAEKIKGSCMSKPANISGATRQAKDVPFTTCEGNARSQLHVSDNHVDSIVDDDVFEDFATSMSACMTNLSRTRESGESLGTSPSLSRNTSCQRYYHVFKEGELEALILTHVPTLTIVSSYYDHANWCLIAEKRSLP